jgi:CRISPR-associated endonuclease/helicase Cas3
VQTNYFLEKLKKHNILSHPNKTLYNHIIEIKKITNLLIDKLLNNNLYTQRKIKEFLEDLIYFHDVGKVHYLFQSYLKESNKLTNYSHSLQSFFVYLIEKYKELKEKNELNNYNLITQYLIVALLILNHHSFLKALNELKNKLKELDLDIINDIYQILGLSINKGEVNEAIKFWKEKIEEFEESKIGFFEENLFNIGIEDYLVVLFTFGIFLFADRLSAFITKEWEDEKDLERIIEELFEELGINKAYSKIDYSKFQEFIKNLQEKSPKNKINELRTQAFKEVEENFEKNKNKKIFKITLPTGLGKTLTGLNIALKLNKELNKPIIYSLPYLSIIEQNYQVIKNIFNEEKDKIVGKFHHLTIFSENEEETSLRDFINFELKPITVTTFIQIFHSIFTNDRNWIIKFPFIATSILIIDETQNLPVSCFEAFDKILLKMTELFGTRIILMSATQPYLLEKKEKIENKDDNWFNETLERNKDELVKNKGSYYVFNRYKIVIKEDLFKEEISENEKNKNYMLDLEKLSNEITKKLKEKQKVGIIVNKVKDSIEIFNKLNEKLNFSDLNNKEIEELIEVTGLTKENLEIDKIEELEKNINHFKKELNLNKDFLLKEEFKNLKQLIKNNIKKFEFNGKIFYLLYLSANLINLEKKLRSNLLKKLENKNLLVISTQVIEAGVDISLDTLFRYIAPLDSIVQSAGRVNRNGFDDLKGELILICDLKGNKDKELWNHVYDKILINETKEFLKELIKNNKDKILEEKEITDPEKIENYFKKVRNSKNDQTCVKCENIKNFIKDAIEKLNFDCIGKFSLIENRVQYNLILDLDFEILKSFNEIYKKISEIRKGNKKEGIEKLKKAKQLRKIEEFFKATRIGKLDILENKKKDEDFKELLYLFEKNNIIKIKESIKELNEEDFNHEELIFSKEQKDYFKVKEGKLIRYYDYFGFAFSKASKHLDEKLKEKIEKEFNQLKEERIENFIVD